ncbi:MAG: hypothetical protein IPJ34_06950 [Myxococcales bacterium]|nr:hypothetical protein [Myxococcales bacterium]
MRSAAIFPILLLVVGCGSKVDPQAAPADTAVTPTDVALEADGASDGTSDGAVLPTEDRTCKRLADALCGGATEACCKTVGIAFAGAGCREAALSYCTTRIDAVGLGKAVYDDSQLEACAKDWSTAIAACQIEFVPYLRSQRACAQLFNGTTAPGAACASSAECHSPPGAVAYCDTTTKRCKASSIVAEGAPCSFTGSQLRYCDEGFYCDLTGGTAACRKQLAEGAACSTSNYVACGYSRTCVVDKCGAGLAGGAKCTDAVECASWNCNAGVCNSVFYQQVEASLCNGATSK